MTSFKLFKVSSTYPRTTLLQINKYTEKLLVKFTVTGPNWNFHFQKQCMMKCFNCSSNGLKLDISF